MKKLKSIILSIYRFIEYHIIYIKCIKTYKKYYKINILDDNKTIEKIINEKKSISRFGDGEFRYMLMVNSVPGFQNKSLELSNRLKEVLTTKNENILICIPRNMNGLIYNKQITLLDKHFWCKFTKNYGEDIYKYLNSNKIYGNSLLTRFYLGYKNKNNAQQRIVHLKSTWKGRNIIIVEGTKSKLGVGNDLFDDALSIKRIICPSKNAFSKYEEILTATKRNALKEDLILIALGPTATVLAYDLSKEGYQALDIGHIDIEYEWFLAGAKTKTPINGKYVNEARNILSESININNKKYLDSIIKEIK